MISTCVQKNSAYFGQSSPEKPSSPEQGEKKEKNIIMQYWANFLIIDFPGVV